MMNDMLEQAQGLVASKDEPAKVEPKTNRTKDNFGRMQDYLANFKDMPEDSPIKQAFRCFCKWGIKPLIIIIMAYIWVGKQLYKVYKLLPMNIVQMVFGAGLCFFGGVYFTAIAAVEAAINLGGANMWDHLTVCWNDANVIAEASAKDDKVDANNDKVPDVEQMSTNDLINHKAKVALMSVKEPQRLQQALLALGNVYIAVIATLKFQFAKTVAIALGVGNMLSPLAARFLGPPLCLAMGAELNHWVPTIIDTAIKCIAVFVATYVQAIISAFYSGLRGGKMFATGIFNIMSERGWMEKMPDFLVTKPFDPDQSYLDEAIAYPIAAVGFYMQITSGFSLAFPFNLILLPLTIIEWFLRFQVYT